MMKIYDVTIAVSETVPTFPGDPKVKIDLCKAISKGDAANVSELSFGAHTGTHVDAPNHFDVIQMNHARRRAIGGYGHNA